MALRAACIAARKTNRSFTGYPRFCLQPGYRSVICADNDNATESQSWFRAVPSDELLDSVLVCAARTGRGKAIYNHLAFSRGSLGYPASLRLQSKFGVNERS